MSDRLYRRTWKPEFRRPTAAQLRDAVGYEPLWTPRRPLGRVQLLAVAIDHTAKRRNDVPIHDARNFAAEHVQANGMLVADSAARVLPMWEHFEWFAARASGVEVLGGVEPQVVRAFVDSRTTIGRVASVSTRHNRRSALRLWFRVLRELRLLDGDPTLDLELPRRSETPLRPLTDDEMDLCRWEAMATLTATRFPAVWALAEAGASTAELGYVTVSDVDLEERRVWLAGSGKTTPRFGELTDWGVSQLDRRIRQTRAGPEAMVIYGRDGSDHSRRTAGCEVVRVVLARSGLLREPDVRQRSVTGWAGRRVFDRTGKIEDAASAVGLSSLDRTAELIGFDWRTR